MRENRNKEQWTAEHLYRLSLAKALGSPSFKLYLTQDKTATIDIEDAERAILLGMWIATEVKAGTWYAVCPTKQKNLNGKWVNLSLHQFVMNAAGIFVDHIDRNGLNCRKENLRITNYVGNNQNATKGRRRQLSVYKGVSFDKTHWRWVARVQDRGKKVFIGYFDTEVEAAKAYNLKAKELHGEYANLNKIEED